MSTSLLEPRSGPVESHDGSTQVLRLKDVSLDFDCVPSDTKLGDLIALLGAELRRRWQAGSRIAVERCHSYLERAGASSEQWLTLIAVEIELRRDLGETPALNEYVQRFPSLAKQLSEVFEPTEFDDFEALTQRDGPPARSDKQSGNSTPAECTIMQRVAPVTEAAPVRSGVQVPGYEILGILGRGGMGIVYKARQIGLNRVVALKMVLNGNHADSEDLARFRLEAEAIAGLRHPNIVQVHDIGEHDGTPYFSMEYVEGGTLGQKIAGRPQTPAFAVDIVEALAHAVHAAHQQNIIHRDLKPANILLSEGRHSSSPSRGVDDTPTTKVPDLKFDDAARATECGRIPKITDFGLAKRLDVAMQLTSSGLVAGTPQYMAPEQVTQGARERVGPAADVYSLGVIVYEMLTGRPPFLGSNPAEIMHNVLRQEPVPIRQLQPKVARDLETICLKCLQKEPHKRYDSADDLAEDLRRYRAGKPILARPVSRVEQAVRWCQRNPTVAFLLMLIVLALTGGTAVASFFAIDAADHARRAEANESEARRQEAAAEKAADELRGEKKVVENAHVELSQTHSKLTETYKQLTDAHTAVTNAKAEEERLKKEAVLREKSRNRELYDAQMIQAHRAWEMGQLGLTRRLLAAHEPIRHDQPDMRGFEWYYLERLSNSEGVRYRVPDGCRSVAMSPDGKELIWAFRNTCEIWTLTADSTRIGGLGADPFEGHRSTVERVAYDPTGNFIATASHDRTVKLWDAKTRKLVHTLSMGAYSPTALRFSPDGKYVAFASSNTSNYSIPGELRICDVKTGTQKHLLRSPLGCIYDLAFSPSGEQIATVGYDDSVKIWTVESGKNDKTLSLPKFEFGRSVTFAPSGSLLAVGTSRGEIILWNTETWREERRLFGHVSAVHGVEFAKDGVSLASAGNDQLLKIWDAATGEEKRTYRGHTQSVVDLVWAPNSAWIFTSSMDQSIKGWELKVDPEHSFVRSSWGDLANFQLLPDNRHIVVAGRNGFTSIWDLQTARPFRTTDFRNEPMNRIWHSSLAGTKLVFARSTLDDEAPSDIWEWDMRKAVPQSLGLPGLANGVRRLAHSADGKRLATGHLDGTIQVHSLDGKAEPVTWKTAAGRVQEVLFPPGDSKHLLVVGLSGSPTLWDIETKKIVRTFAEQSAGVRCAAVSGDGKYLATGGDDQSAYLWETATGRLLFKLQGHTGAVRCLAFSPDGERLVTGGSDYMIKLWDTRTGHETLTLRGHTRDVAHVKFAPDSRRILSFAGDNTLFVWDAGHLAYREFFRAAAAACRLNAFHIEEGPEASGDVTVHFELANASGKKWPVPPDRKFNVTHRTFVRLFAAPIRSGKIDPREETLIGQFDMLPMEGVDVDYSYRAALSASLKLLGTGTHRLRLEHGWRGDEIVPISEKIIEIDRKTAPPANDVVPPAKNTL